MVGRKAIMVDRKAIMVTPYIGEGHDYFKDNSLDQLNEHLSFGWEVEKEIIIPCNAGGESENKGLSSVIIILKMNRT